MNIAERMQDEEECLRRAIENKLDNLRVAMPGRIADFNAEKQTATVQPLIKEYVGGKWESLPLLMDVPCFFPRAGGYCLTFPVKLGDECLIIFNDMCLDAWWQSGGEQTQLETRRHDLSDAMCLLGITSVPRAVKDYSTDSLMLRNEARNSYFEITNAGHVNINVAQNCTISVKGNAVIDTAGNTAINTAGNTEITSGGSLNLAASSISLNG